MRIRSARSAPLPALLLAAALAAPAAAQSSANDSGPRLRLPVEEIALGARVQTLFSTSSVDSVQPADVTIRRVYLEASVKVNAFVGGKLQMDFAGDRAVVRDAYLRLNVSPGLQLLAGNAYKPFSLIALTSDTRILPIERGALIRGAAPLDEYNLLSGLQYTERDLGLQVLGSPTGAPLGFGYAVGAFRGPLGGSVGDQSPVSLAARATVEPLQALRFGAAWSSRDFRARSGDALQRGHAFELDAEYGDYGVPGLHLVGELATGDFSSADERRFTAAQAWLGYRTPRLSRALHAVEPTFRLSVGDVDAGAPANVGTLLTPGVGLYFGGLNRVSLNYDVWLPKADENDTLHSAKLMFQLAF